MARKTCDDCGRADFKTDRGLEAHRRAKHPPTADGPILAATDRAIAAASHLTAMDAGAVEVLRDLARVIDGANQLVDEGDRPLDNVTKPTYLKYATELGLTPLARLKLGKTEDRSGSKLAQLRSIEGGQAS